MEAWIYARFSSDKQAEGYSLERQFSQGRAYVERMGWKILKAKTNLISDEAGYEWIVCAKECKAGESFALRTDKYCAPIVLTK